MSTVLFRRRGDRYTVKFSYDPDLVELLKNTVPAWARSWDPYTKEWMVTAEFGPHVESVIRRAGHTTVGLEDPQPAVGADRWAEVLFEALTKVLHPDVATGDTALMQELNNARERLNGG